MTISFMDALVGSRRPEPPPAVGPITPIEGGTHYASAALAQEVERVRMSAEGTRNHTLNEAAFKLATLVAAGALDEAATRQALLEAALAAGLDRTESVRTIGSGFKGGGRAPRDLSDVRELTPPSVNEVSASTFTLSASESAQNGEISDAQDETEAPERARTSWWAEPIETLAAQAEATPAPDILVRADGVGLFYRGKTNGLLGESESGKSWCALHGVHQAIAAGDTALILDFEDTAKTTQERLRALGATPERLTRVYYASPDQALDVVASGDLSEALAVIQPAVIVVDGVNAAMSQLGLDLNSNTDATVFAVKLLKPLAATGAAVITVDHVPKNVEQRGKGGIGAQAKRAMLTGCALRVEVAEPFGRGQSGRLKLFVDKDRPGFVRGNSASGKYAGSFVLESVSDDRVNAFIEAPKPAGEWRPTHLMEAISDHLERVGPCSKNAIELAVQGKASSIREALQHLISDGYVTAESGERGAVRCSLLRPFSGSVTEVKP